MSWKIVRNREQSFAAMGVSGEGLGHKCVWCGELVLTTNVPFVLGPKGVYHLKCAVPAISELLDELWQTNQQLIELAIIEKEKNGR